MMMKEIEAIKNAVNPNEILFVVDSMTGQDAVNTAKEFNDRLNFDGVVLTKLDGDTRGWSSSFYSFGSEQVDQICGNGGEDGCHRCVLPEQIGRSDTGNGRHRFVG